MKWWGSRLISSARTKRSSRSARENCCDSITCRRRVVTATKKSPSPALWPRLKGELGRVYRKLVARMAKRPGHVEVLTEVGFCNFCNRTRNLRNEEHHLGGLVRTIVTCEMFGLLGPNGAGKTTTLRVICTLLTPDAGTVSVLGFDTRTAPVEVRRRVGVVTAEIGVYPRLTARENITYFAQLSRAGDLR